jgi:hypothetical protein
MTTTTTSITIPSTTPYVTQPKETPRGTSSETRVFSVDVLGTGKSGYLTQNSDYQKLIEEIQNTISKNDQLFKQIQESNYPNAGSYQSDLVNYKIDNQIKDLTQTRQQIWDFINKKYNENTNLKRFYFDENRKADDFIKQQMQDFTEINSLVQSGESKSSVAYEKLNQLKYNIDRTRYYRRLYLILIAVQIIMVIILALSLTNVIPKATSLIIVVLILVAALGFVIYYVFFVNIGRNKFAWHKFDHNSSIGSGSGPVVKSSSSLSDTAKSQIDTDLMSVVNSQKNKKDSKTCDE